MDGKAAGQSSLAGVADAFTEHLQAKGNEGEEAQILPSGWEECPLAEPGSLIALAPPGSTASMSWCVFSC